MEQGPALEVIRTRAVPELGGGTAIVGRLQDLATGEPIAAARVQLGGDRSVTTGAEGDFRLTGAEGGPYTLTFQHIAYGEHQISVPIDAGTEVVVLVKLAPEVIALDPVAVTVRSDLEPEVRMTGVRRHVVAGTELAEAVKRGATIADVVSRFPGLRIREGLFNTDGRVFRGVCIESRRSMSGPSHGRGCNAIPIIIDGIRMGSSVDLVKNLHLSQFESVELVGPIEASMKYGMDVGAAGGALVLRTRRR